MKALPSLEHTKFSPIAELPPSTFQCPFPGFARLAFPHWSPLSTNVTSWRKTSCYLSISKAASAYVTTLPGFIFFVLFFVVSYFNSLLVLWMDYGPSYCFPPTPPPPHWMHPSLELIRLTTQASVLGTWRRITEWTNEGIGKTIICKKLTLHEADDRWG